MRESLQKSRRVCVVGGGISGLAAAHRLLELRSQETSADSEHDSVEVLLLEASARAGGTVRTYRREGFLLEGGPDSFISEKPAALELAKRLGLADRIIQTNGRHRRSFVVSRGRLRPTPEGFQLLAPSRMLPFLTTDIFTWRGKARMALDLVLPRRRDANGSSDESLAAFVRRRFGQDALAARLPAGTLRLNTRVESLTPVREDTAQDAHDAHDSARGPRRWIVRTS